MPRDERMYLFDIRKSAQFILDCTNGKSLQDYLEDNVLRAAVERHFIIIGEALNQIRRVNQTSLDRITEHNSIIAFRNILVHGYEQITHEVVWEIVQQKLPTLIDEVDALLRAVNGG